MINTVAMAMIYILILIMVFYGTKICKKGEWNEEYCSLGQTKILLGIMAFFIPLHHMAQKTCAPWHPQEYMVHGLDPFLSVGHMLVSVFLFCSGIGLYMSFKNKKDYLDSFIKKRVLPLIAAFYLSEWIYLAVRLLMGEEMRPIDIVWYLSGLHMANMNCWYIIIIIFFYIFFYFTFRFFKKEGAAIAVMFVISVLYAVFGAFLGHPEGWWMRGEWWYNSIILFPLGLLFAKHEKGITSFFKKWYVILFPVSVIGTIVSYVITQFAMNIWWGYYGEYWGDPHMVLHRMLCCLTQWVLCIFFVAMHFLFLMKFRIGNRVLVFLGGITLELYLMHGMFVEIFGYDFLELADSLYYIRSVPLYVLVVFACSFPLALLYRKIWKAVARVISG